MSEYYNLRKLENAILNVIKAGLSLSLICVIFWSVSAIYELNYIKSNILQNITNIPVIFTIGLGFLFSIQIIRVILITLVFSFSEKRIYGLYSLPILMAVIIVIIGGN